MDVDNERGCEGAGAGTGALANVAPSTRHLTQLSEVAEERDPQASRSSRRRRRFAVIDGRSHTPNTRRTFRRRSTGGCAAQYRPRGGTGTIA